jgi:glycosyltransferase involved in cell wall biosynthesis
MIDFCIDVRMAFSSGIGTYIREVVPLLKGFRVILLVDKVGRSWCKELEQIAFDAPIYSIKEQLLYPLKIPSCDLFWSPHYNIPLLPIRAKKRVATIHDACHLIFGSKTEKIYAKWVMGKALKKSNEVITVSQFSKREIERLVGKGNLHPIPIGVNLQRFVRVKESERVRKKYQLPKRYVLFVGNQKPHKNIDGLERAFTKAHVPGLELVVAGKGTRMGQVEDQDLPALYSMAEAFVFPSFYEGFGLPPLEAMSCGCPTAVSNAASIPEVCGDASLYFNPSSDEEMAEAIVRAVENPEPLIKKGFERVKQFDWEICAKTHIELFEKVCHA